MMEMCWKNVGVLGNEGGVGGIGVDCADGFGGLFNGSGGVGHGVG